MTSVALADAAGHEPAADVAWVGIVLGVARRVRRAAADLRPLLGAEPVPRPARAARAASASSSAASGASGGSRWPPGSSASALGYLATRSGVGKLETVVVWSALFAAMLRFATPLDLRRARRDVLGALRRREHRARGDDVDGRLLRDHGRRQARLVVARSPRRHRCPAASRRSSMRSSSIHLRADQIVSGTAINFLALGVTGYLFIDIYGTEGTPTDIPSIPNVHLAFLDGVPFIGDDLRAAQPDDLDRDRPRPALVGRHLQDADRPADPGLSASIRGPPTPSASTSTGPLRRA